MQTSLPTIAHLTEPTLARETIKNVRLAAREYVRGDYRIATNWISLINAWLATANPTIRVVYFDNIEVQDGGVFHISKDTQAISVANSIKLYGTGLIEAEADLAIDCTSMEGYIGQASTSGGGAGGGGGAGWRTPNTPS